MMKNSIPYIALFVLLFLAHLGIWHYTAHCFYAIFFRYYLLLGMLFFTVLAVMVVVRGIYFNYLGFAFLGLTLFKLAIMLLFMDKLGMSQIPNHKLHFIVPYLISLAIETFFSINLIKKAEKNQF